jgi:hypothetical protein
MARQPDWAYFGGSVFTNATLRLTQAASRGFVFNASGATMSQPCIGLPLISISDTCGAAR